MTMSYDANGSPVFDGPDHTTFPDPPSEQWSGVKSLVNGFSVLGTDKFPAHLCVIPHNLDPSLLNATDDDYHIVMLVDARFRCMGTFRVMRPYTYSDPEEGTTYGWIDRDGNFVSHGELPTYEPDDAKVVAWRPCYKDFDLRA